MNFQEFLNKSQSVNEITKKVVVGDRFKDEEGNDFSFTIKAVPGKQYEDRRKMFAHNVSGDFYFDSIGFSTKLVVDCVTYPNFKDAESIKQRGKTTPEEYVQDVLKPGEIEVLANEITKLSGYGVSINDLIEEAKN